MKGLAVRSLGPGRNRPRLHWSVEGARSLIVVGGNRASGGSLPRFGGGTPPLLRSPFQASRPTPSSNATLSCRGCSRGPEARRSCPLALRLLACRGILSGPMLNPSRPRWTGREIGTTCRLTGTARILEPPSSSRSRRRRRWKSHCPRPGRRLSRADPADRGRAPGRSQVNGGQRRFEADDVSPTRSANHHIRPRGAPFLLGGQDRRLGPGALPSSPPGRAKNEGRAVRCRSPIAKAADRGRSAASLSAAR